MGRDKCKIVFESEADKKVAFVKEFLEKINDALSGEVLKSPEQVSKQYGKVVIQLSRKYGMMMSKSEILKLFNDLVQKGELKSNFIIESLLKNKSVRSSSGVLPISVATDGNNFSCAYDCHFCPNECTQLGAERDISRSYLSSEGTFIRGAIEDFDAARSIWRRLIQLEMMGHPPDKCEIIVLGGTWDCYPSAYRDLFIQEIFYACNVYHLLSLRLEGPFSHHVKEFLAQKPFMKDIPFDKDGEIRKQLTPMRSLEEEKKFNETAPCGKIIGIVLETRPDQINRHSLLRKRVLGCTRIQLGIQSTNNEVLDFNNRGHTIEKSVQALHYARDACFKVDGHLMPDLPSTTLEIDYKMVDDVFNGDDLQLDYCKLYPCLDLPYTKSREWKEEGVWKPIAENNYPAFLELMCHAMASVPPWTRVNRVQRDFPEAQEKNDYLGFVSENIKSNLQEEVLRRLKETNRKCRDIRCREIRTQHHFDAYLSARLYIRCYRANGGTEFFLTVEIPQPDGEVADDATLIGLLRLRLPDSEAKRIKEMRGELPPGGAGDPPNHYLKEFRTRFLARVRELHVYGNVRMVEGDKKKKQQKEKQKEKEEEGEKKEGEKKGEKKEGEEKEGGDKQAQHSGVGKFLMAVAERVSWMYGFDELAVISGVGVRGYYEKLGYHMDEDCEGEFMVKSLPIMSEKVKWAERKARRRRKVGEEKGKEKEKEPEKEKEKEKEPEKEKEKENEGEVVTAEAGRFLPLVLFGNKFSNEEIQTPLSHLTLASTHLPIPTLLVGEEKGQGEKMDPVPKEYVNTDKYVVRSYDGIQDGKPQLVVVKGDNQRGSVTAPASKYANTYLEVEEEGKGGGGFGVLLALLVLVFGVLVGMMFGEQFL